MSIERRFIENVDFLDALPTGEYVGTVKTKPFVSHLGPMDLPRGETWGLHYLRCSKVNGFHFAGQAHTRADGLSPLVWEWKAGSWRSFESETGRGAYDSKGIFRDGQPNGIQYVEDGTDRPVSRIDTYNDPAHGLSEWTKRAGLQFGQGNGTPDGGVIVFDGTYKRILFPPGEVADFINVNLDGDRLAVSFVVAGGGGWICIGSVDDFKALPIWTPAPAPIPPTPNPQPQPTPEPPVSNVNHLDIVQRVAQSVRPDGTMAGNLRFVQAVLAALPEGTAGYVGAPAGGENVIAVNGVTVRTNRVMYPDGQLWKIITDSGPGGANGVAWNDDGIRPELFVQRSAIEGGVQPPPQPPQPPTPPQPPAPEPVDLSPVLNALAELHADQQDLRSIINDLSAKIAPLLQGAYGTVAVPYLGSARVDLTPGIRPKQ